MSSKFAYLFLSLILVVILVSCGQRDKYREDYGTIVGASLLVSNRHVGGYGRSNCLLCHNISLNVHQRTGYLTVREDAIAGAKVSGSEYCKKCHGVNGL
jgi:hypothetical protein